MHVVECSDSFVSYLQVRLNLLRPLLEEAYSHLHRTLCASTLGRKLFLLPFHRDVAVTERTVRAMQSALTYCKQVGHADVIVCSTCVALGCVQAVVGGGSTVFGPWTGWRMLWSWPKLPLPAAITPCQAGGVLLTTPEHRLSMLLKRQELWEQGKRQLCDTLGAFIEQPCFDLLDESDELLHHRLQLI